MNLNKFNNFSSFLKKPISLVGEVFVLLSDKQKTEFFKLQILLILMAVFELVGIAAIAPFMALVVNPGLIDSNTIFNYVYNYIGFSDKKYFLILVGLFVLLFFCISSLVSIFATWKLLNYSATLGADFSNRLFYFFLKKDWKFHSDKSAKVLAKKISSDCNRVTNGILVPLLKVNAKLMSVLFIFFAMCIYNFWVSFVGVAFFLIAYIIVYCIVSSRVKENAKRFSKEGLNINRLLIDGLGGVKDLIMSGRIVDYFMTYQKINNKIAIAKGDNNALSLTPRYLIELVAFGGMILLIIYLLSTGQDFSNVFPLIAFYALASLKLLPAMQSIYHGLNQVRNAMPAFNSVKKDLMSSQYDDIEEVQYFDELKDSLKNFDIIELKNIYYSYGDKLGYVINDVCLKIKSNTMVAFVGESGSGKSTILDLIVGAVQPDKGEVCVDSKNIEGVVSRAWRRNIGYVSQDIYLSDASILENIAFGLEKPFIDINKINNVLKLANLEDFISQLPNGIYTKLGEKGIKISGGQRQRLGIARALYNNPKILVLDEATSALDGLTEKLVMNSINELSEKHTIIIIAHRLNTVKNCDCIFFMDKGKIVDSGTYNELLEKNKKFAMMVNS